MPQPAGQHVTIPTVPDGMESVREELTGPRDSVEKLEEDSNEIDERLKNLEITGASKPHHGLCMNIIVTNKAVVLTKCTRWNQQVRDKFIEIFIRDKL